MGTHVGCYGFLNPTRVHDIGGKETTVKWIAGQLAMETTSKLNNQL